ncbi:MAG: ethanolamine ammonia-lyase reactivating factor EutA [Clostridia bacterium]|nr:ethanolamine ammonia-lyase reactivating factor EutA [Clostridia bacterium]
MASILSVGIDIGTSTTQVIFSRIDMENMGGYFSVPRVSIVDKQVVFKSPVYLTPLKTPILIDGAAVRELVAGAYRQAGYTPADVNTGAVIITGESARKENAAEVLSQLSDFAGEFVVSTAGPDLESIIAGKGSGAYQYSMDNACTAVNLDIGGGTTNMVMFKDGEVIAKGCLDIGGRLIRLEKDMTVTYISPAVKAVADEVGAAIEVGRRTDYGTLKRITDKMADLLAQALGAKAQEALIYRIQTPESTWFESGEPIRAICFSGGVADCIAAEQDDIPYGDIGVLLGRSIAQNALLKRYTCISGSETIRATVVGAGTYTTSISGSTIDYAQGLLPMKNIPALKLSAQEQSACFGVNTGELRQKIRWFMEQSASDLIALAMTGEQDPDYPAVCRLAECLSTEMDAALPQGKPLIVILEHDMAKVLGMAMRRQLGGRRKVICLDSIKVEQGDYVDMGRPVLDGMVIPIVVKTLLFG